MAGPETAPDPTLESRILEKLGYTHCLDRPITVSVGSQTVTALGRNFLDTYPKDNPAVREHTEDLIGGFLEMNPGDSDYAGIEAYIRTFLVTQFGPPVTE